MIARKLALWLVLVAAVTSPSRSEASTLYTLEFRSNPGLFEVDTETGAGTLVAALPDDRGWLGISSRPGSARSVWTTSRTVGSTVGTVSRIDVQTGQLYDLYSLGAWDLGYENNELLELSSIAIDPSHPSTATLLAYVLDFAAPISIWQVVFTVDLDTGALLGPVHEYLDPINADALAYSLDGSQLYVTVDNQPGVSTGLIRLATIDPATGDVSEIGPLNLPGGNFATGLAFEPETGELYGIHAYNADALVRISPSTGSLIQTIGPIGIGPGPTGLAFVPEPGTGLLLVAGLLAASRSRRRGLPVFRPR